MCKRDPTQCEQGLSLLWLGVYPQNVALESHLLCFKNTHLQSAGIQIQNNTKQTWVYVGF
jgi:hypothetical protein